MLKVYKRKIGDVTVLCLQGQLLTGETGGLREAVFSELHAIALVLDLARVSRIDAGGLGALLELREHTLSRGIEFRLINVTDPVRQVFEITCLNSVFEISSERDVAAAALHGRPSKVFETACA